MALSIASVKKVRSIDPPRILIYAPPKMGKSTLANEFPNAINLQLEDGTPGDMEIDTFGLLQDFGQFHEAFRVLGAEDHDFKTLIVDTVDSLEPMLHAQVCYENGWGSIDEPEFGKGYTAAADKWRTVLRWFDGLRKAKGMNIVLLGHADVKTFSPPGSESYSRYSLRLHHKSASLVYDDMDLIAFINQRAIVKKSDEGFGKTKTHAEGGGSRWIYTEGRAAFEAGSRYNTPAEQTFDKGRTVDRWAEAGVPIAGYVKPEKAKSPTP